MRTNVKKLKKINVKDLQFSKDDKEKEKKGDTLDINLHKSTNDPHKSLQIQKNNHQPYLKRSMNQKENPHYVIDSIRPKTYIPIKTAYETPLHLDIELDKKSSKTYKENNLVKEYDLIREIWLEIGVTEEYQNYFEEMLKNLSKDEISEILSREKKQISLFKSDLERLNDEIAKRENDIETIKIIDKNYLKMQLTGNYSQNESIENEIKDCLKLIRLHTINTIIQFNKFRLTNYFNLTSGKIDINQMKNGHIFMMDYLIKINNDLNFLKKSNISQLYHFSEKDPFFLSLLKNSSKNKYLINEKRYKHLGATKDTLSTINDCLFILAQEELFYKLNRVNKNQKKENDNNTMEKKIEDNNHENQENNVNYEFEFDGFKELKSQKDIENSNIILPENKLFTINKTKSYNNDRINSNSTKTQKIKNYEDQQEQFYLNPKTSNSSKNTQVKNKNLKKSYNNNLKNNINNKRYRKENNFDKLSSNSSNINHSFNRKMDIVNKNWDKLSTNTNRSLIKLGSTNSMKSNKKQLSNLISQFSQFKTKSMYDSLPNCNKKSGLQLLNKRFTEFEKNSKGKKQFLKMTSSEELKKSFEFYDKIRDDIFIKKANNKENYKTMWYVDSAKEFKNEFEDYYDSLPLEIIYAFNLSNNKNIFFEGIQPKILINKKLSNNKIFGICAVSYVVDENNNKILKIKHLSAIEKDSDNDDYYKSNMQYKILNEFLNILTENNNLTEIDFYPNDNEGNKLLFDFLVNKKMFKIFKENKMENKIILRKGEINQNAIKTNIVINIKKTNNIDNSNNDASDKENTENIENNDINNKENKASHQDNNNKNQKIKINLTGFNMNSKNNSKNATTNNITNVTNATNNNINNTNNNQATKNQKIKINLTNFLQKKENNTNQIENNDANNNINQKNDNTNNKKDNNKKDNSKNDNNKNDNNKNDNNKKDNSKNDNNKKDNNKKDDSKNDNNKNDNNKNDNKKNININLKPDQKNKENNQNSNEENKNSNDVLKQDEKLDISNDLDNDIDTIILGEEDVDNLDTNKPPEIFYSCNSILSLIDKRQFSSSLHHIQTGKSLYKIINTFNLNLLINSLKVNNAFTISNSNDQIIIASNKYISNSAPFISDQNNNCTNLQNIPLNNNLLIVNKNNTNIKYSYLITSLKCKLEINKTIKYNNYFYHGIKIDINNNVTIVDDDIALYNLPTSDENITVCLCPYNKTVKKIIKKYDKNKNMFNSFNTFLNLVSLYINDVNGNKTDNSAKLLWIPCFNIDTQMIVGSLPDYKHINIQNSFGNHMNIVEYNELLKVGFLPGNNFAENESVDLKQDMIIGDDFLFCLCHKDIKNKFNLSIISLAYVTKENWNKVNK